MKKNYFVVIKQIGVEKYDILRTNKSCTLDLGLILTCDTYEEAERIRKGLEDGSIIL